MICSVRLRLGQSAQPATRQLARAQPRPRVAARPPTQDETLAQAVQRWIKDNQGDSASERGARFGAGVALRGIGRCRRHLGAGYRRGRRKRCQCPARSGRHLAGIGRRREGLARQCHAPDRRQGHRVVTQAGGADSDLAGAGRIGGQDRRHGHRFLAAGGACGVGAFGPARRSPQRFAARPVVNCAGDRRGCRRGCIRAYVGGVRCAVERTDAAGRCRRRRAGALGRAGISGRGARFSAVASTRDGRARECCAQYLWHSGWAWARVSAHPTVRFMDFSSSAAAVYGYDGAHWRTPAEGALTSALAQRDGRRR